MKAGLVLLATNIAATAQQALLPTKSGPGFSIKKIDEVWWLQNQQGQPFFSRGVCCVNPGLEFKDHTLKNPGYAAWHHFAEPLQWAEATSNYQRRFT